MTSIYFAKLNVNTEIYEVYDNKLSIKELRKKIFNGIDTKVIVREEANGRYKFFDIDYNKSGLGLVAKLGHIKPGVHSTYDPENDTAIDTADPNKIEYVVFYIDLDKELIAYTTNNDIRKKRFIDIFTKLMEEATGLGISLNIISNTEDFATKFKNVDILKKIEITMLPPNDDEDDFEALFGGIAKVSKETKATNVKQEFSTRKKDGLVKNGQLVKTVITGSNMGYVDAKFVGKRENGKNITVTTQVVPWKAEISTRDAHDNNKVKQIAQEIFGKIELQISKERNKLRNKRN